MTLTPPGTITLQIIDHNLKNPNVDHDHPSSLVGTKNGLKIGCVNQLSPLVWAVFGLSNAGQTSIWLVTLIRSVP